jgi:type VI secretion system protein VasD
MISMLHPFALVVLAATLLLGGCNSSMTKLDLSLSSSGGLNPDLNGRPSPIVLRLIELKHPAAFEQADFFAIYRSPKESLNPHFVTQEELELRPGESRKLRLSVQPGSRYVGVLAAYRDLSESQWRYVIPLQEQGRHRVRLRFDERAIHDRDMPVNKDN